MAEAATEKKVPSRCPFGSAPEVARQMGSVHREGGSFAALSDGRSGNRDIVSLPLPFPKGQCHV
jgi:hypothetical protein